MNTVDMVAIVVSAKNLLKADNISGRCSSLRLLAESEQTFRPRDAFQAACDHGVLLAVQNGGIPFRRP